MFLSAPPILRRPSRDLHVLHIGKTGGSALKHALGKVRRSGTGRIYCHGHRVMLDEIPRGADIVFTLRDPVSRVISGFNSRKRRGRPLYDIAWNSAERAAFARFPEIADLARGLVSDDEGMRHAAMSAFDGIQHVRDRYWRWFGTPGRLRQRADDILLVARQERLAEDFELLKKLAGLPPNLSLPRDAAVSHRAALRPAPPAADALAILRAVTAQDFGLIEFCERELGLRPCRQADPPAPAVAPSQRQAAASEG